MANNGTGSLRQGPAQDVCAAAAEGDCLHCIARLQIRVCEEVSSLASQQWRSHDLLQRRSCMYNPPVQRIGMALFAFA